MTLCMYVSQCIDMLMSLLNFYVLYSMYSLCIYMLTPVCPTRVISALMSSGWYMCVCGSVYFLHTHQLHVDKIDLRVCVSVCSTLMPSQSCLIHVYMYVYLSVHTYVYASPSASPALTFYSTSVCMYLCVCVVYVLSIYLSE